MGSEDRARTACPSEEELRRYHACELAEAEHAACRNHLEQCPECAARADRLLAQHDTWVAQLRRVGLPPEAEQRPAQRTDVRLATADLNGYDIVEQVSAGGQGIVYRAIQQSTKREVAIKVLREGLHASPAARRRFEREIEIVAGVSHPNIVTVFDSGQTYDGHRYFVMDFVRGQPLGRYLRDVSPALGEQLALFVKICRAVNMAHQRGVIHRDLKPSNVLVDERGEPRVLDFGLARHVARGSHAVTTTTGQVAGTLPYLSPEQARGLPDAVDVRSDVYSLGVILYEMLTGTYPYPAEGDTIQVLRHIAETPPTPPNHVLGRQQRTRSSGSSAGLPTGFRRIPDELQTITLKALSKDRERRYQTAGDLARDIERFLAGEPIEAKRDSGLYMLKKTLQRYRIGLAVAATFMVLISGSAVGLGMLYANQLRLRAEADRQARAALQAETRASRRFTEMHTMANSFIVEFDPLIKRLPGAAPARQALAQKALKYLDALAQDAAGDTGLLHDLAAAYMTIGDVQGEPQASNLGDFDGALTSYRKAADMLEEVLAARSEDANAWRTAVLNALKIGDVSSLLGDLDGASASYRDAVDTCESWRAAHPGSHDLARELVNGYERLGNASALRGDHEEALVNYAKSREIADRFSATWKDDLLEAHRRIANRMQVGSMEFNRGRPSEALDHYTAALATAVELRAAHPDDVAVRRELVIAQQWVGIVRSAMGQHEDALSSYHESIALLEQFLADDPDDVTFQQDLATTLSKLGESCLALGHHDAARAAFQRSTDLTEKLVEQQPDLAGARRLLGVAYYKLAEFEIAAANDEQVAGRQRREHWQKARDWLQRCRRVFLDLRHRGTLAPGDEAVPEELAQEIEQATNAILDLDGSAGRSVLDPTAERDPPEEVDTPRDGGDD